MGNFERPYCGAARIDDMIRRAAINAAKFCDLTSVDCERFAVHAVADANEIRAMALSASGWIAKASAFAELSE